MIKKVNEVGELGGILSPLRIALKKKSPETNLKANRKPAVLVNIMVLLRHCKLNIIMYLQNQIYYYACNVYMLWSVKRLTGRLDPPPL